MANKKYTIEFENDANAPKTLRGTVILDGVEYDVAVVPKPQRVTRLDRRELMEKQSVSQGPSGGACPMCGR